MFHSCHRILWAPWKRVFGNSYACFHSMVEPGEVFDLYPAAVWATGQLLQVIKLASYFNDPNERTIIITDWKVNVWPVFFLFTDEKQPRFRRLLLHLQPPPPEREVLHLPSTWWGQLGRLGYSTLVIQYASNNVLCLFLFSLALYF